MTKLLLLAALAACHDTKVYVPATPSPPGQMTVTGTATLEVSPDCADLTMTLSADDPTPGPATAEVQREEEALVAALTKLGVEGADLKLSYLTLQPVYDDHWLKIRTYRAQITVTATTTGTMPSSAAGPPIRWTACGTTARTTTKETIAAAMLPAVATEAVAASFAP